MKQLTQNLKDLLREIGEGSVLLRLSIILANKKRGWRVYRSYSEDGCDVVARRVHGKPTAGYRKELRFEVKARQNLLTQREGQQIQFSLTKGERDSCHFLVAYWFDRGDYFIVPKKDLKPSGKKSAGYRFVVNVLKNGDYNDVSKKYLNRWESIEALIK
jgi:hypothetical protein